MSKAKVDVKVENGSAVFADYERQAVADLLVAAFEGGINYWVSGSVVVEKWPAGAVYASDVPSCGGSVVLNVDDDGGPLPEGVPSRVTLNYRKIMNGIRKAAAYRGRSVDAFLEDNDAADADIAVQFAAFGEAVFG